MANNTCAMPPELYQGDGTTKDFSFAFQYIKKEDVVVYLWDDETNKYQICTDVGTVDACSTSPVSPTEYYFKSAVEISFCQAPPVPDTDRGDNFPNVLIGRLVDICAMVAYFYPGTSIRAQDLNNNFTQVLLALQDVKSRLFIALQENTIVVEQIEGLIQSDEMQDAPYPVWDDESIGTAAADVRYFATLVQGSTPDSATHWETGKVWFKNNPDGELYVWDGTTWDRIGRDAAYKEVIDLAEQRAGEPVSDDSIFTTAASAERFDTFVQTETPLRTDYEVGKTWLQNDVDKTLSIWDGDTWVGVASGGTFTTQPTTIYVDSVNGNDTNDGHRLINPMRTIKAAVEQCNTITVATTATIIEADYNNLTGLATFTTNVNHNLYVGTRLTFSTQTWSCDNGTATFPEADDPERYCTNVLSPTKFEVQMEPSSKVHTFVENNPTVTGTAGFLGDGWIIYCAPGIYEEEGSIEVRARNVSVVGASIRSTFIHPTSATEYNTMFLVDSGFYLTNFTIAGLKATDDLGAASTVYSDLSADYRVVDSNPVHGLPSKQAFVVALRKGSVIRKSPYIQNCTNFADAHIDNDNFDPNNLQGEGGDTSSAPTGGGILCDGSAPSDASPLRSFVVDAFTQIALDGPGILCTNNGYAQLVSFFGTFCRYHAKSLNGGQLNLSNCTTDFGEYGLIAEGKSKDAKITGNVNGNYPGQTQTVTTEVDISSATYDNISGLVEFTTATDHNLVQGMQLTFSQKMNWTCELGSKKYPDRDTARQVLNVVDATTFQVQMAPSVYTHTYVSNGKVFGTQYDVAGAVVFEVDNLSTINNFTTNQPGKTMVIEIGSDVYPILRVSEVSGDACSITISNPKPSQRNINLGLINGLSDGQSVKFKLQSYISTGGHTFEFVGSGTDYRAHPDYGGFPNPVNQVIETGGEGTNAQFNGGRVWVSSTDQDGQFRVGNTLVVDQKTGYINIDPSSVSSNVESDLEPNLGGDLNVNGYRIIGDRGSNTGLIKLETSSAVKIAAGTTAQQPSSPEVGMIRFNTDEEEYEGWNGEEWDALGGLDPTLIGTSPSQIPVNGYLGKQAFVDEVGTLRPYFASGGFYSTPQTGGDIQFRYVSDTEVQLVMKGLDGTIRSTTLTLS